MNWLSKLFGKRPSSNWPTQKTSGNAVEPAQVEAALNALAQFGLTPVSDDQGFFHLVAGDSDGGRFMRPIEPRDGFLIALQSTPNVFREVACFDDHCYDVADQNDCAHMIAEICALASDWSIDGVSVINPTDPQKPIEWRKPMRVEIRANPSVEPFELMNDKDFDWSVIYRLNERLPLASKGKFCIFLDGYAIIAYVPPSRLQEFNDLTGWHFFCEEESI